MEDGICEMTLIADVTWSWAACVS